MHTQGVALPCVCYFALYRFCFFYCWRMNEFVCFSYVVLKSRRQIPGLWSKPCNEIDRRADSQRSTYCAECVHAVAKVYVARASPFAYTSCVYLQYIPM